MQFTINAKPQAVKPGNFHYANTESRYGVNTQSYTKDGKPADCAKPALASLPAEDVYAAGEMSKGK